MANTLNIKEFPDKLNDFINQHTNYYRASIHRKYCKICHLPTKQRNIVDQMLMEGKELHEVQLYLTTYFPNIFVFGRRDQLHKMTLNHKKYLPFLLEDVAIKTIFKRARHFIENKDLSNLSEKDKVKIITDIENELIKEYSDIENERISVLNLLFKETIPLLLTRLHYEIVDGKAKDVKEITDASQIIWKMGTSMAAVNAKESSVDEEELDYSKLDEINKSTKHNVLSLTDKINKATKGCL